METGPLYGDTTDIEDLLDSSGVGVFPPISHSKTLTPCAFPEFKGEFHVESGQSSTEQEEYRAKLAGTERQLTAKKRTVIRKHFSAASPIQLSVGHPSIALNEGPMHVILRTIANESVISSYHMMKSFLLHDTSGSPRDKKRKMPRRCATPARQFADSSAEEGSIGGHTWDGYTSGAINSDEDPYQLGSISGTDNVSESDPLALAIATSLGKEPGTSRAKNATPISGSGYSSTDFQPLSTLWRPKGTDSTVRSPPHERRKLMSKQEK